MWCCNVCAAAVFACGLGTHRTGISSEALLSCCCGRQLIYCHSHIKPCAHVRLCPHHPLSLLQRPWVAQASYRDITIVRCVLHQAERMLLIEECLRKRTALKPLEEALIIGVDARAHHGLLLAE